MISNPSTKTLKSLIPILEKGTLVGGFASWLSRNQSMWQGFRSRIEPKIPRYLLLIYFRSHGKTEC